ncbi:MAG: chemotaxis response regulator protein-glutamate methylesterase [Pedosphaera sp.]|nr:chemotaxis response regulator protein-glutamate methylesterase [Pedosphaera sp.]
MRIAIVNDMLLAIEAMRRVLTQDGRHEVVWTARDGREAVEHCQRSRPDLILMDLVMPHMDGIEATRRIMAKTPCAIVIVTASVTDHTAKVFEAMGAGALDAVNTPVLGNAADSHGANALLAKVDTIRRLIADDPWEKAHSPAAAAHGRPAQPGQLVVIGASAGWPAALVKVLSGLPADFAAAVVIIQHVDAQFAAGLAQWLGSHTPLSVRLAEEGDPPRAGQVLLAGRDHHLVLSRAAQLGYSRAAADCAYRPSVDFFFKSVAEHWQGAAVGVLLTGMGRDGAEGLLALRARGFPTIAQDESTSAVYGMPKAAAELQAAGEILALDKIAPRLVNVVGQKTKP